MRKKPHFRLDGVSPGCLYRFIGISITTTHKFNPRNPSSFDGLVQSLLPQRREGLCRWSEFNDVDEDNPLILRSSEGILPPTIKAQPDVEYLYSCWYPGRFDRLARLVRLGSVQEGEGRNRIMEVVRKKMAWRL